MENKLFIRWKLVRAIRAVSGMFVIASLIYAVSDFLNGSKG
ncbi:MAG: hypothetical protein RIA69_20755 [Cyclobacteriaceae bacterium]